MSSRQIAVAPRSPCSLFHPSLDSAKSSPGTYLQMALQPGNRGANPYAPHGSDRRTSLAISLFPPARWSPCHAENRTPRMDPHSSGRVALSAQRGYRSAIPRRSESVLPHRRLSPLSFLPVLSDLAVP